jgi:putative transposase
LAIVIDLFSRQVVGWAIAGHMKTSLCVSALQMAFLPAGHKGAENRSLTCAIILIGAAKLPHGYRKHLSIMKMEQSMSRKGNCWERLPLGYNSPTEQFFRSLNHEQLNYEKFRAKASAKLSVIDYLAFYNGKHTHSNTAVNSPLQFERDFYRKAA